jgi:hypothetical protein
VPAKGSEKQERDEPTCHPSKALLAHLGDRTTTSSARTRAPGSTADEVSSRDLERFGCELRVFASSDLHADKRGSRLSTVSLIEGVPCR